MKSGGTMGAKGHVGIKVTRANGKVEYHNQQGNWLVRLYKRMIAKLKGNNA